MAMMVGLHIPPPLLESPPLKILSTTFKAKVVCLALNQPKELKLLAIDWNEQRVRATEDVDWYFLLDYTQCHFWAS